MTVASVLELFRDSPSNPVETGRERLPVGVCISASREHRDPSRMEGDGTTYQRCGGGRRVLRKKIGAE